MDKPAWMNAVVYGNQLRIVQVASPHMMSPNFGWGFIILRHFAPVSILPLKNPSATAIMMTLFQNPPHFKERP
ncbi:hypothetical protein LU290_00225 [Moraxella nasibovis]|uniref:hypothetical protein n=1 Tax=Moraxella nasibovis TaxID=2904120 RepID=UPI00240FB25A|nr:hypothetical protein [Moraxella nasibovis]WFF38711.1 hypothetical protein LU290_00225 [Moraxella nasibovis]